MINYSNKPGTKNNRIISFDSVVAVSVSFSGDSQVLAACALTEALQCTETKEQAEC
jgi:hypothetical protein